MFRAIGDGFRSYAEDVHIVTTEVRHIYRNIDAHDEYVRAHPEIVRPWRFPYFRDYGTATNPEVIITETGTTKVDPRTGITWPLQRVEFITRMSDSENYRHDMESRRGLRVIVPITLLACVAWIALVLVIYKYAIKKP